MGYSLTAICKDCGTEFRVSEGGGFFFHLLHCDVCGKDKSITLLELGDDAFFNFSKEVEILAGACDCGGHFKFNAKPRCPNCKSTNYKSMGDLLLYD